MGFQYRRDWGLVRHGKLREQRERKREGLRKTGLRG